MHFKLLLFVLILRRPLPAWSIIKGNKFSIQMVPWLVYGEGYFKGNIIPFSANIIHPEYVLTLGSIAKLTVNITLRAGVADLKRTDLGQSRTAAKARFNDQLGILKVHAPFKLGLNVQLGSLADRFDELNHWQLYLAAGWGQVNWYNTYPTDLNGIAVYASYHGLGGEEKSKKFLLVNAEGNSLRQGQHDLGGPVWDPMTGEIVGIIYRWEFIKKKTYHSAFSVGNQRGWIRESMSELLGLQVLPADATGK